MGSTVVRGEAEGIVTATGADTFFGKTATMIKSVDEMGHFQKILLRITFFLLFISLTLVRFMRTRSNRLGCVRSWHKPTTRARLHRPHMVFPGSALSLRLTEFV